LGLGERYTMTPWDCTPNPTAMVFAPDGSLFVAEQRGTLQVADTDGQLQEKTFLDIRG
jgi:hypothetical protein